ncbi:MAG: toxin HicA [Gammaproteobacteria bacterium]|nr:MAG: toxin HicA [Gammaproteobacteria bacterium]
MSDLNKVLSQMKTNAKGVRFSDIQKVCKHYFGKPRQGSSSHCIYKTPWIGNPRINIQNNKGKAKPYQVKQVLIAINKLEAYNE